MASIFVSHFRFPLFLNGVPHKCSVLSKLVRCSSHDLFRFTTIEVGRFDDLLLLSFNVAVLSRAAAGVVVRSSNELVRSGLSPLLFSNVVMARAAAASDEAPGRSSILRAYTVLGG